MGNSEARFRSAVDEVTRSTLGERAQTEWANPDNYMSMDAMQAALKKSGLESCNLIVGIDFTRSNVSQGARSFHSQSLHALDSCHGPNPYELAISIIGEALQSFDEDNLVPAYVFGDVATRHLSVRQIGEKRGCEGKDGVLRAYREAVRAAKLSGPTSFAALIDEAVAVVRRKHNSMHILLILADGQVSEDEGCAAKTKASIVRAAAAPLSIVMVGLGDGPWEGMMAFDDGLPERKFDNFQFVPFARFHELIDAGAGSAKTLEIARTAFGLCALQELPDQYRECARLGLLGEEPTAGEPAARPEAEPPAASAVADAAVTAEPPAKRQRAS